ncbi:hypothetical protein SO802_031243 [Lithocarpus litseifolius]|uniref:Uncharacterized protein n=1 Tax=Lithocarpus litseifolius TaxID=425828 RepID=A0AAW2BKH7_9ROSI
MVQRLHLKTVAKGLETSSAWPRPHLIAKPLATVLKPQLVEFLESILLQLLTSQKIVESRVLSRSALPPTVQKCNEDDREAICGRNNISSIKNKDITSSPDGAPL